jgi:hypothetical protein
MKKVSECEQASFSQKRRMVYSMGLAALAAVAFWFGIGLLFLKTHADVSPAQAREVNTFTGQWTIAPTREPGLLNLNLMYSNEKRGRGQSITGSNISPAQLRGLTPEQMASGGTNVQFQIVRDAGTFNCEGYFKNGRGSGSFTFAGNPDFVAELRRRSYEAPTEEQLFKLAMSGAGIALLDELQAQGYERPTLDQFVRMGDHGVSIDYVRDLKAEGYSVQSVDLLTRMVDHGVTVNFIRELASLGYKELPVETLVRTVDHGVKPDYIRDLATLGHRDLPLAQLTRMVDHGVTTQFIREVEAAGYGRPSPEQLTRMVDHGVNARFIEKAKARGYNNLTIDELVRLADHGFDK